MNDQFASLYADNLELNESLFAGPGLDTPAHRWQEAAPGAWRRSCAPVVSGNWSFIVVHATVKQPFVAASLAQR